MHVCVCTRQVCACKDTHTNQSLVSRAPGDVRLECRNFGARSPAVTSLRRCQVGPELRNLCRHPRLFLLPSRLRFLLRAPMLLQQQVPLCSHLLVLRGAKQLGRPNYDVILETLAEMADRELDGRGGVQLRRDDDMLSPRNGFVLGSKLRLSP